jgi:hypothetical protein
MATKRRGVSRRSGASSLLVPARRGRHEVGDVRVIRQATVREFTIGGGRCNCLPWRKIRAAARSVDAPGTPRSVRRLS